MNTLCLVLLGALVVLAVQSPNENPKKDSPSEEVISERLRRSAFADPSRKRKARKKQKAKKTNNNMIKKEVEALSGLKHKHIVKLLDAIPQP